MTPDTSGPASLVPLAYYDPVSSCWKTSGAIFPSDWPTSSETCPPWGMTRGGELFALPTPELPTVGHASSSWQPTPLPLTVESAWAAGVFEGEGYLTLRLDCKKPRILLGMSMTDEDVVRRFASTVGVGTVTGPYAQRGLGTKPTWRWTVTTRQGVESLLNRMWLGLCSRRRAKAVDAMTRMTSGLSSEQIKALLPPPRTSDTNGAGAHGTGGPDLRTAVTLLPTPAVNDMGEGKTPEAWDEWTARMRARHGNGNGHGNSLAIEAQRLLPTPKATNNENDQSQGWRNLGTELGLAKIVPRGAHMPQPSPDGSPSPDDQLPGQLSLDATAPD